MPDAQTFLTVAISSRALFDLDDSDAVYREQGLDAYRRYQIQHENETLEPGSGLPFVTKLLGINKLLGRRRVDVILLSRNSADTGLRVFNSIATHGLDIRRAAFSSGSSPIATPNRSAAICFFPPKPRTWRGRWKAASRRRR